MLPLTGRNPGRAHKVLVSPQVDHIHLRLHPEDISDVLANISRPFITGTAARVDSIYKSVSSI